jgi:hypothetical protein
MKHRFLAVALVAAAALVGVFAASGAARSSQSPRTINFTLRGTGGFFPPRRKQQPPGTRYGTAVRVAGDDGSKGSGDVLCTFIKADDRLCNVQLTLSKGNLALQGIAHGPNVNEPFIVTGGTGAYAVARGSALVNDVDPSSERTPVRFTVTLPAG